MIGFVLVWISYSASPYITLPTWQFHIYEIQIFYERRIAVVEILEKVNAFCPTISVAVNVAILAITYRAFKLASEKRI